MTGQELYDTWCEHLSKNGTSDDPVKIPSNWWFLSWAERDAWMRTARDLRVIAGDASPPGELDSTALDIPPF
jgi:hypothetical protein